MVRKIRCPNKSQVSRKHSTQLQPGNSPSLLRAIRLSTTPVLTLVPLLRRGVETPSKESDELTCDRKGKWWLGNLLQHHYIPNTAIQLSSINSTLSRFQTGTYLFVSAQRDADDDVYLNGVANVTEANIPVTNVSLRLISPRFLCRWSCC